MHKSDAELGSGGELVFKLIFYPLAALFLLLVIAVILTVGALIGLLVTFVGLLVVEIVAGLLFGFSMPELWLKVVFWAGAIMGALIMLFVSLDRGGGSISQPEPEFNDFPNMEDMKAIQG